jgi:Zn-dependent protease
MAMVLATPALKAPWGLDALLTLTTAERAVDETPDAAISPERLLLALLAPPDGGTRRLLGALNVDADAVAAQIQDAARAATTPEFPGLLDRGARAVLGSAAAEARALGSDRIEDLHLLLGLLCGPRGPALDTLERAGVDLLPARAAARDLPSGQNAAATRLRETGLTLKTVRAEAARLMGDPAQSVKLMIVSGAQPTPRRWGRNSQPQPAASPWKTRHRSAMGDLLAATRPSPLFYSLLGLLAAIGVLLAWEPLPHYDRALIGLFILVGWLISVSVHEYGHAAVGYLGGDHDTQRMGYLTLDMRRYAHPLLTIGLPLIGLFLGRLPLPGGAVYVNPYLLRSRKWDLAVSAAGPAGTLVCLLLSATPFIIGGPWVFYDSHLPLWVALGGLVAVQAVSLVLNLLPIPPLDGFHILSYWLSPQLRAQGFALGWTPVLVLGFFLRQGTPIGEAFWGLVYGIEAALRLPTGLGDYAMQFLSLR